VEIDAAVDDDEIRKSVQKKIWASLKDKGSLRVVNHRGVEMGDVAVVNFVAMRAETGKEISGSRQVKMHLDTVEGEDMMGLECKPSLDTPRTEMLSMLPDITLSMFLEHV
jgi:hypothetical protein